MCGEWTMLTIYKVNIVCDEWTMLTLYKMKTVCGEWAMLAHYGVISWGTGIAQWLEHQTCDRMVAGSSLSRAP